MFVASYLIGSIPWAYIIVKGVTGEDITDARHRQRRRDERAAHDRTRGAGSSSRWWPTRLKGLVPVVARLPRCFGTDATRAAAGGGRDDRRRRRPQLVAVAVAGQAARRCGGKGLATGGGALLAYDWRYFLVALVVGLGVIALTRYMMAGQVAAVARAAGVRARHRGSRTAALIVRARSASSTSATTSGSSACSKARSRSSTSTTARGRAADLQRRNAALERAAFRDERRGSCGLLELDGLVRADVGARAALRAVVRTGEDRGVLEVERARGALVHADAASGAQVRIDDGLCP